jgi:hypothetical protein
MSDGDEISGSIKAEFLDQLNNILVPQTKNVFLPFGTDV